MSDIAKLIAAERNVALIADDATAHDLERCCAFWSGQETAEQAEDVEALSDGELRARLIRDGIDPELPDGIRALVGHRPVRPCYAAAAALAACIAVAAVSVAYWPTRSSVPMPVVETDPPAADPADGDLIFLDPDRPSPGERVAVPAAPPEGGTQRVAEEILLLAENDLSRAEIHEMQRLLNGLGYGPVARNGLFSEELGAALLRFRADRGMDPAKVNLRDTLVTLRYAARLEVLGEKPPQVIEREGD